MKTGEKRQMKLIEMVDGKIQKKIVDVIILEVGANSGVRVLLNGAEKWTEKSNII